MPADSRHPLHVLRLLILAGMLGAGALADDFYVDAQTGSDGASGAMGDPWRTLSHALAQLPDGVHTLHVGTGTYDAAHGEVFPIPLRAGQTILGAGDVTVETSSYLGCFRYRPLGPGGVVLDTLRLRGSAGVSLFVDWENYDANVTLRNLDVSVSGPCLEATTNHPFAAGTLTLENVHVYDTYSVVQIDESDCSAAFILNATDCTFERLHLGVDEANVAGQISTLNFDRCHFRDIQGTAIFADLTDLTLVSCLLEDSASGVIANGSYNWGTVSLSHTTIAGMLAYGVSNAGTLTTLQDSVLWDNGDDLDITGGGLVVQHSNVEDGDGQGQDGTISADPLFRDPAAGDYRLSFGSPCVDTGSTGGIDLEGFPFDSDGDLDTLPAPDMGAYELRTLVAPSRARIGTKLHLDAVGHVGQFGAFFLGRSEPLAAPDVTPFGRRWIPEVQLELLRTHKILGPEGVRHTVYLPDAPPLVGLTFSFQTLTRSPAAPLGAAWSDVVAVEFLP